MNYLHTLAHVLPDVDPELLREIFEERAAVREYEAGFDRDTAERLAFVDTIESV